MVFDSFIRKIFPLQTTEGTGMTARVAKVFGRSHLKILSLKQMLQRLPIVFPQSKVGNTSKTYLMKFVKSYTHCTVQKKLLKKVYNNIMNSTTV